MSLFHAPRLIFETAKTKREEARGAAEDAEGRNVIGCFFPFFSLAVERDKNKSRDLYVFFVSFVSHYFAR